MVARGSICCSTLIRSGSAGVIAEMMFTIPKIKRSKAGKIRKSILSFLTTNAIIPKTSTAQKSKNRKRKTTESALTALKPKKVSA